MLKRYERVCFTKYAVRPIDRPGLAFAQMVHPGHPLMLAVSDLLLEQHSNLLRQGAILVDPSDDGVEPHLLFLLTHEVKAGGGAHEEQVISKRLQFVQVAPDGSASFAGWAPHLDLDALSAEDQPLLNNLLAAPGFVPTRSSGRWRWRLPHWFPNTIRKWLAVALPMSIRRWLRVTNA